MLAAVGEPVLQPPPNPTPIAACFCSRRVNSWAPSSPYLVPSISAVLVVPVATVAATVAAPAAARATAPTANAHAANARLPSGLPLQPPLLPLLPLSLLPPLLPLLRLCHPPHRHHPCHCHCYCCTCPPPLSSPPPPLRSCRCHCPASAPPTSAIAGAATVLPLPPLQPPLAPTPLLPLPRSIGDGEVGA